MFATIARAAVILAIFEKIAYFLYFKTKHFGWFMCGIGQFGSIFVLKICGFAKIVFQSSYVLNIEIDSC